MKNRIVTGCVAVIVILAVSNTWAGEQIKVLSWNIWHADGNQAKITEVIQTSGADIIGFQELSNPSNVVHALEAATGDDWHLHSQSGGDSQIISKYPILGGSGWGAQFQLNPTTSAWLFNVHFAPYPYQPYDLRDGRLPMNEAAVIAAAESSRGSQATGLANAITSSGVLTSGDPVFVTGDFNEPSHLDWTQAAADATPRPYDLKVEYPASKKMTNLGLEDAFRTVRPDEVNDPAYTWTPGAPPPNVSSNEVHDRIDFVYFGGDNVFATGAWNISLNASHPSTDIGIAGYPSDHRAVLAAFMLPDPCDFEPDGDCDVDDVDLMVTQGDLSPPGLAVPPADARFDLDGDNDVDTDDYSKWLTDAATANGHATAYRASDTDLDRDIDITDFNNLATDFDPGGFNATVNGHSKGNSDGDNDIDITDFNRLASTFSPGGYDGAIATVDEADPGQVDLMVDLDTGEVFLGGNAASISGLQVFSASNSLLTTDFTAEVLQFVISTNTSTYAEGAFLNMPVDGTVSLGILYDLLVDAQDLTFEYTIIGQPTLAGNVIYIPEPASLAMLALGVAVLTRRRGSSSV